MTLTADQVPVREGNTPNGAPVARVTEHPARASRLARILLLSSAVTFGWMLALFFFGTSSAHAADSATPPDSKPGLVGNLVSGVVGAVEQPVNQVVSGATNTVSQVTEKVVAPVVQHAPAPVREVVAVVPAVTDTVSDVVAQKPVTQIVKPVAQTVDTVVTELPVVGDIVTSPVVSDIVGSNPVQGITDPITGTVDGSLGTVVGGTDTIVDGSIPGTTPGTGGVVPGLPGLPGGDIVDGILPGLGGQDASPAAAAIAELRATNVDAALALSPAFGTAGSSLPAIPFTVTGTGFGSPTSSAAGAVATDSAPSDSPLGGSPFGGPDSPFGPAAPANGNGSGSGSSGSSGGPGAGTALDSADYLFQAHLLGLVSHTSVSDDLPSSPVFESDVTPD